MKWHKGPPPSVGWWPASGRRNEHAYRWWDGKAWSWCAFEEDSAEAAGLQAKQAAASQSIIEWRERPDDWPARSRT